MDEEGMTLARVISIGVAALALSAPPAQAACGGVVHSNPTRDRLPGKVRPPLAIGDSVMLGAVDEMAAAGFEVNVRGCRQMSEGLDLMRDRKRAGTLPRAVLVLLGANWTISQGEIREGTRILGPKRVLVMLTPTESGGGAGSDAYNVRQAGRRWPERVVVLDWAAYSAGRPWFSGDSLHLGPGGAAGLARLSSRVLHLALPPREAEWTFREEIPGIQRIRSRFKARTMIEAAIEAPFVVRCTPSSCRRWPAGKGRRMSIRRTCSLNEATARSRAAFTALNTRAKFSPRGGGRVSQYTTPARPRL